MRDFKSTKQPSIDKCGIFHRESLILIWSNTGYQNSKHNESLTIGKHKYTKGKLPVLEFMTDAASAT